MITVAVGTALYASSEVRHHVGRALDNGVTQTEIAEVITMSVLFRLPYSSERSQSGSRGHGIPGYHAGRQQVPAGSGRAD